MGRNKVEVLCKGVHLVIEFAVREKRDLRDEIFPPPSVFRELNTASTDCRQVPANAFGFRISRVYCVNIIPSCGLISDINAGP